MQSKEPLKYLDARAAHFVVSKIGKFCNTYPEFIDRNKPDDADCQCDPHTLIDAVAVRKCSHKNKLLDTTEYYIPMGAKSLALGTNIPPGQYKILGSERTA